MEKYDENQKEELKAIEKIWTKNQSFEYELK